MSAPNAKIAVVTGANRGIGFEICRQLAEKGFQVLLGSRDAQKGLEAAERLKGLPGAVVPLELDLSNPQSVSKAAATVEREFGKVDVLVNNAGAYLDDAQRASMTDLSVVQSALDTNLFGTWRVTQAFVPLLGKSKHPRIVNVSSGAGSYGDPTLGILAGDGGMVAYSMSKAALNLLTVKLAQELRPRNFLVNAVCPGFTATQPGNRSHGSEAGFRGRRRRGLGRHIG